MAQTPTTGGNAVFWPWLRQGLASITQPFGENGETGVDMGLPLGTPITSLTSGRVVGAGYYGGGGVVAVLSVVNNKSASVYYQHLDLIAPAIADALALKLQPTVQPGDLIGYSGGQLSGGHHPSTRQFSSGPHLEVGINAPYGAGSMWHPVGANYDPLPWLRSLDKNNGPLGGGTIASIGGALTHPPADAFLPILTAFKASMYTQPVQGSINIGDTLAQITHNIEAVAIRGIIAVCGLLLVAGVLANIIKHSLELQGGPVSAAIQTAGAPAAGPVASLAGDAGAGGAA